MKVLDLVLKGKWYDMIESGIKKEEYREIKPYWNSRLLDFGRFKRYDFVKFRRGYTSKSMTFKIDSITKGKGNTEWGAPDFDVFIIKLGERVK